MRVVWLTDIHLNFIGHDRIEAFCRDICAAGPDAILISGDIGEAASAGGYLQRLEGSLPVPIYFVLGNHDYYGSSLAAVREEITAMSRQANRLYWLPSAGVVELTAETGLVGHDGWADARFGDYANSQVMLNDYLMITELRGLDRTQRQARLNVLGDAAAEYLRNVLPQALSRFHHLLVLTHVPPFREACWHEGKISGDDYLPHFSCKAVGDVLVEMMQAHPERKMTVLCGHTHSSGEAEILPNLLVRTGAAVYGRPQIQDVLEL
jgi:3',5'-cyclic AMP phosphodiesterase CpdA